MEGWEILKRIKKITSLVVVSQTFFMFTPIWGNDPIRRVNIFQMGWLKPPSRSNAKALTMRTR